MPTMSKFIVAICALVVCTDARADPTVTYPPSGYSLNNIWWENPSAPKCKLTGVGGGLLNIQGVNGKYNCDCIKGVCKASSCHVAFNAPDNEANCPVGKGSTTMQGNCAGAECMPWGITACNPATPGAGERCFGTVDCVNCINKGKLCLLDGKANANTFENFRICTPAVVPSPAASWSPARSPEPSPSPGDVPNGPTGDECKCDDKYRNELCKKLEKGTDIGENEILPGGATSTSGFLSYTIPECQSLELKAATLESNWGCKPAAGCDTDWICEKEVPLAFLEQLSEDCGKIEHRTII